MANLDRMQHNLAQLAAIGATAEGGVTRLAFSPEEREAHQLAARWMAEAGLQVRVDSAGNTFGTREGSDTPLPTLMIGSHLDSVNNGGRFDGTLGFVGALEAVRTLEERGQPTRHPLTLAIFAGEEAARFADAVLGSKMATGQMERSELDRLVDAHGISLAEAMRRVGFDPERMAEARWDPSRIAAYLELHIEQGQVLEKSGCKIGIVTAIAAATRYRVTLHGSADHSGATPMGARRDAAAAAAEIVLGVERIAGSEAGPTTVGTVGILKVKPGAMTIIPGWAEMGIDLRDTDAEAKARAAEKVVAMIEEVCRRRSIQFTLEKLVDHVPARMSPRIREAISAASTRLGYPCHSMRSAAGHDARIMAFVAEAGMIFVPSRGGISHSPQEWTEPADLLAGAEVLLETVLELDSQS